MCPPALSPGQTSFPQILRGTLTLTLLSGGVYKRVAFSNSPVLDVMWISLPSALYVSTTPFICCCSCIGSDEEEEEEVLEGGGD